jgi:hypothetical protein
MTKIQRIQSSTTPSAEPISRETSTPVTDVGSNAEMQEQVAGCNTELDGTGIAVGSTVASGLVEGLSGAGTTVVKNLVTEGLAEYFEGEGNCVVADSIRSISTLANPFSSAEDQGEANGHLISITNEISEKVNDQLETGEQWTALRSGPGAWLGMPFDYVSEKFNDWYFDD